MVVHYVEIVCNEVDTLTRAADFFLHGDPADPRIMSTWASVTERYPFNLVARLRKRHLG